MSGRYIVAAVALAGCTHTEDGMRGTRIVDAAQASLEGVQIGVGNFSRRDYTRSDGTHTRGLTVTLFPAEGQSVVVGEGDIAILGDHRFLVRKIEVPFIGKAFVELEPAR